MTLSIQKVDQSTTRDLIDYCLTHGPEHDDSFLPGRDFKLTRQYPAYLLWQDKEVVGAVVLMRSRAYLQVLKGRFSIFHSVFGSYEAYSRLLDTIRPHFRNLKSVFLFMPETKQTTASILFKLSFHVERYSYILENRETVSPVVQFPHGYYISLLDASDHFGIAQFAQCVNESFAGLAGHTESTPEDIQTWFDNHSYLERGLCLLKYKEKPIGTIAIMRDSENQNAAEVLAFGIIPEQRGKGLGRNLLRYARAFAISHDLQPLFLSVNAENRTALSLYESEGFESIDTMVCYALDCE